MNRFIHSLVSSCVSPLLLLVGGALQAAESEASFKSLFNGKDLTGWAGRPEHWSVEDGAITGRTTKEKPAKGNNFLIAKDGEKNLVVGDFELRLSYKIVANNDRSFGDSGIQYRSKELPDFVVSGYQANLMVTKQLTGILYEEKGRGIIHQLGQKVVIKANPDDPKKHKIETIGSFGKSDEIPQSFKSDDWNDYVVIAKGACPAVDCRMVWRPVCGRKNGKNVTYANVCIAEKDSASVIAPGSCPEVCVQLAGAVCAVDDAGQRKNYTSACIAVKAGARVLHQHRCLRDRACASNNKKQVCAVDPQTKNQKTYPTHCDAEQDLATLLYEGACRERKKKK